MPGPLPNAQRRRRNTPTISTSQLPAEGRKGRIPKCPYELASAGDRWWRWAWRLPQAAKWDDGALYVVARRAQLEDSLDVLDRDVEFDADEVLGVSDDREAADRISWMIGRLKSLAGGSVTVMREMRELDNRLGLNPKALAELRWTIEDAPESDPKPEKGGGEVRRLRAVDPRAASA